MTILDVEMVYHDVGVNARHLVNNISKYISKLLDSGDDLRNYIIGHLFSDVYRAAFSSPVQKI